MGLKSFLSGGGGVVSALTESILSMNRLLLLSSKPFIYSFSILPSLPSLWHGYLWEYVYSSAASLIYSVVNIAVREMKAMMMKRLSMNVSQKRGNVI